MLLAALGASAMSVGCMTPDFGHLFHRDKDVGGYTPSDRPDLDTSPSKLNGDLDKAQELFRKPDYSAAAKAYEHIFENKKNSPAIAEEAMYYSAECHRMRNHLTEAQAVYTKQLNEFPSGAFKQQACQRLYDIAMYWLKETEAEINAAEKGGGSRWLTVPPEFRMHLGPDKPTLDMENRALQALEVVHYSDMTGPVADKAVFWIGYVKFFREEYHDADHYFTMLLQFHKDSPLAPRACELAILCKTYGNGGPSYDGRPIAEARQLVDTAMRAYPELTQDEAAKKKMMSYLSAVTAAQADKDLERAKFYERTEHPGSAYIVYEMIRRRYPNTPYEEIAESSMARLKPAMEKSLQPEELTFLDKVHREWNKLWGLDPNEDLKGGSIGVSPASLPAGAGPGH